MDCSTAASFYSLNEQIAAERAANSPPGTAAAGGEYKARAAAVAVARGAGIPASPGNYARSVSTSVFH